MKEQPEDLRTRTKRFALNVIRLSVRLPKNDEAQINKRQMLRSATSVAVHYREACRAKSDPDFISKLEGGLQELDETCLWFELLIESGLCNWPETRVLRDEANELISIFVAIIKKRKDR